MEPPLPSIYLNPIDPDGNVTLTFNQDMFCPSSPDLMDYNQIFVISVVSVRDDSTARGMNGIIPTRRLVDDGD